MIELRASAIKASTSVLPFVKVTLTRSTSALKYYFGWFHCCMFLQNLPGEREG